MSPRGVAFELTALAVLMMTLLMCLFAWMCFRLQRAWLMEGVIDVAMPLEDVEAALARSVLQLTGLALAGMLVGGALLWLIVARRLRGPVREILSGIRHVTAGDLSYRIPTSGQDEFAELAESVNTMSNRLAHMRDGLIQSQRLISMGKLAAGVAHEINNPITGVLAYAEALLEDSDPSDPRRKDYEVIVHETLRCRRLVRNLLDMARPRTPTLTDVRAADVIERAIDLLRPQASFRNIRFHTSVREGLPDLLADPEQIQQVLVNLMVNAQQAMPEGGTISIRARLTPAGDRVELSVEDRGSGVPPEIRPRIFEPFYSTKGGVTEGLGLTVCRSIVKQHDGAIELETEPGKGTTFRVFLPIDAERPADD